jgi:hypothetical protein
MLPRECRHITAPATLLPPLHCRVCRSVTIKLLPPPLPPHCRHCHHCRQCCQASAAATKLPLLPLSTLQDKFDNEKELCNMTDVDFVQLSCSLFQLGIKFSHEGMLPIFDALIYLSLYCNNL